MRGEPSQRGTQSSFLSPVKLNLIAVRIQFENMANKWGWPLGAKTQSIARDFLFPGREATLKNATTYGSYNCFQQTIGKKYREGGLKVSAGFGWKDGKTSSPPRSPDGYQHLTRVGRHPYQLHQPELQVAEHEAGEHVCDVVPTDHDPGKANAEGPKDQQDAEWDGQDQVVE